jgi:hypothetical protein
MNSIDIERALDGYSIRGVFSSDTLPEDGGGLMVCNTDPHYKPGRHWIAMYVDRQGEYFDSFGRPPAAPFRDYMDEQCEHWICNERQLQSVASPFCGHYCVFYCMLRSLGVDLRKIVASLTDDTGFNDVLVHGFICGNK